MIMQTRGAAYEFAYIFVGATIFTVTLTRMMIAQIKLWRDIRVADQSHLRCSSVVTNIASSESRPTVLVIDMA